MRAAVFHAGDHLARVDAESVLLAAAIDVEHDDAVGVVEAGGKGVEE